MQLEARNSPFSEEQAMLLNQLLSQLTKEQQLWLSGFLTAHCMSAPTAAGGPALSLSDAQSASKSGVDPVTILFGTETGNAQELAETFHEKLMQLGIQSEIVSMNDYKPNKLKQEKYLLIIVSTHGEGEPPDHARSFYEWLHSRKAPKLEHLKYSVLALGDSSYEFFCQTGKDFDKRLEELGASRICSRQDCDLDFDEPAAEWFEAVIQQLRQAVYSDVPAAAAMQGGAVLAFPHHLPAQTAPAYSRTNPFMAEVFENINLIDKGSNQEVRHLELSLEDSGFVFEPGDCLGIYPQNQLELVEALMEEMNWDPEAPVRLKHRDDDISLKDALLNEVEITQLTKPMLQNISAAVENDALQQLVQPELEQELRSYMDGRDLLDLIRDFSLQSLPPEELLPHLRKMPARLYSIASSQKANPDEAHLTIKAVRYHAYGRDRFGVCSVQCADRIQPGDVLPVYVHRNPNFRLPADASQPIIMIGPGTGVAPFRAFLEEREEIGASGKSWLFFGNRHFHSDFLYQTDWQRWLKEGVLTRMDVAFSRDGDQKVYVQHRMMERSKELYEWLQEGAVLYVCGDEKHMAKDVHAALQTIVSKEGGMSMEQAESYLTELKQQKRYQRDVY